MSPPFSFHLIHSRHVNVSGGSTSRGLSAVASAVLALEEGHAVLVHLDLRDLDLGRVDADVHGVSCCRRASGDGRMGRTEGVGIGM